MANYSKDVCELVRLIPKGKVSTYGIISDYLGLGSPRMVGWILNKSVYHDVPAHRVINRNGELTGRNHFGSPDTMARLLIEEGHSIKDNKVVNFEKALWYFD